MVTRIGLLYLFLASAIALAAPARGDDSPCATKTVVYTDNPCAPKVSCPETCAKGDLHCMSAKLNCGNCDYQLNTKFSVCVRRVAYEDCDVVLTPMCKDRDLSEYKVTVPAVKNGLFQQSLATISLPASAVDDPHNIRVRGELVERCSKRVLDTEKARPCVPCCCKKAKPCNPCDTTVAVRTPCDPCATVTVRPSCDPCRSTVNTIYRRPSILQNEYVRPVPETQTIAFHETRS